MGILIPLWPRHLLWMYLANPALMRQLKINGNLGKTFYTLDFPPTQVNGHENSRGSHAVSLYPRL